MTTEEPPKFMADTYRVMVDIETLSLRSDAVILSFGAVWITPDLQILFGAPFSDKFYAVIERAKSQEGRHIDVNTVEWWMGQNNYPATHAHSWSLPEALTEFSDWFELKCAEFKVAAAAVEVWAKGTDFDIAILRDAYASLGIAIPWGYNSVRDLRTLLKTTNIPYTPKELNPEMHNALGDAKFQAQQLVEVLSGVKAK